MYRWSCLSMEAWHVTPYTGIIREKSRVHYVVLYVEYVHGGTLPVKSGANVEAISTDEKEWLEILSHSHSTWPWRVMLLLLRDYATFDYAK